MVAAFYDEVYKKSPGKWSDHDRDRFAFEAIHRILGEPESLLDFGCGNGHTLEYFRRKWSRTILFGYDISPEAVKIASKKVDAALSTQVPEEKVEIVTCLGVAEHFEKADLSPLRLGAYLYLEVPNCLSYSDSSVEGFRATHGGSGQMEWHLKRKTWHDLIEKAGFEIVESLTGGRPSWEFVWIARQKGIA